MFKKFDVEVISSIFKKYPLTKGIFSTVVDKDGELVAYLENNLRNFVFLDETVSLPIKVQYKTPKTLGRDRLAAAVGANYLQPGKDLLVIDAGTAITYELIDASGSYLGGNISPGMTTRFRALNQFTKKLPLVVEQENIPLVGNVFKQLGNSLGFYGDYSKYAKQLTASAEDTLSADADGSQESSSNSQNAQSEDQNTTENNNADKTKDNESYSKTVDGTTVTLSEVYCNEMALYLSMTIHTEDKFPDTFITSDGKPNIKLSENSTVKYDYMDEKSNLFNAYLDGKMLDDNTYAGVLRIPVEDMTVDDAGWTKFYEVRNAFFKEKGIDVDSEDFSFDKLAQALGMDEYSDEKLPQVGGPAISDYVKDIKVPDRFTMELDLKDIVGTLPDDQDTTPDIPQDLRDEYNQKMAEHGISTDDADYESLTEEQKNLEHQFFTEMWNEYFERYPEAIEGNNRYNSWTLKGDWKFNVDVEKNTSDTVKKDVNVVDENGDGVLSITKTPFEITMKMQDPEAKYFAVMLDANGDIMPYGGVSNSNNTYAIQDRDISTVYIYLCDYYEYMDELKGYYWSDDYEEKAKTRTFKQLLDERAVAGTEVHFDTDK